MRQATPPPMRHILARTINLYGIDLDIEYTSEPNRPARLHGHPDTWAPDEDNTEILSVRHCGEDIPEELVSTEEVLRALRAQQP